MRGPLRTAAAKLSGRCGANMETLRVTLKKSLIGRLPKQRRTVAALGLGRVGSSVEQKATPGVLGMIRAVSHLVEVESLSGKTKET